MRPRIWTATKITIKDRSRATGPRRKGGTNFLTNLTAGSVTAYTVEASHKINPVGRQEGEKILT